MHDIYATLAFDAELGFKIAAANPALETAVELDLDHVVIRDIGDY